MTAGTDLFFMRCLFHARWVVSTADLVDVILFSHGGELLAGGPFIDGDRALLSGNYGLPGV